MSPKTVILFLATFQVILSLCKQISESPGLSAWLANPNEPIANGAFSFVFKANFVLDAKTNQSQDYALKYIKTEKSQWAKPRESKKNKQELSKIEKEEDISPKNDIAENYQLALQMKESDSEDKEFKQEIENLEFLSEKSNSDLHIVKYHGCFALGENRIILVQDFLSETVDHRIMAVKNPFKSLPLSLVVRFMAEQILDHLAYMHDAGVAHCDFKGENLMFVHFYEEVDINDHDKQLTMLQTRLIDFGFSSTKLCGDAFNWWGTPGFMPPESFDKRRLQPGMHFKQDIFAAGITLIDVLQRRMSDASEVYSASRRASETSFKQSEHFEKAFLSFKQQLLNHDSQSQKMIVQKEKLIEVLYKMVELRPKERSDIATSSAELKEISIVLREIEVSEIKQQIIAI